MYGFACGALLATAFLIYGSFVAANTPNVAKSPGGSSPTSNEPRSQALDSPDGRDGSAAHQSRLRLFAERLRVFQIVRQRVGRPVAPSYQASGIVRGRTPLQCLTQAVYYESRGEPREGQIAVAQVVVNRQHLVGYPKSVCGVVFQGAARSGCQFSFACEGSRQAGRLDAAAWYRAEDAAKLVLDGRGTGDSSATHYHTGQVFPRWDAAMIKLGQIGHHLFFGSRSEGNNAVPQPAQDQTSSSLGASGGA
jgi:hypothetical protein